MLWMRKKRGNVDIPVWLIWMLIALVVLLFIISAASGKMAGIVDKIGQLLRFR